MKLWLCMIKHDVYSLWKGTTMKTAIVFYSKHHQNTRKLIDAIKAEDKEVELIDVTVNKNIHLSEYERIGVASGIYYAGFAKSLMTYLSEHLPENKQVFALYTCGQNSSRHTKGVKRLVKEKNGTYLGEYGCLGFDSFGPFKLVGGLRKGHPTEAEIRGAVEFYKAL